MPCQKTHYAFRGSPVGSYWHQFGAILKETVTIRMRPATTITNSSRRLH